MDCRHLHSAEGKENSCENHELLGAGEVGDKALQVELDLEGSSRKIPGRSEADDHSSRDKSPKDHPERTDPSGDLHPFEVEVCHDPKRCERSQNEVGLI